MRFLGKFPRPAFVALTVALLLPSAALAATVQAGTITDDRVQESSGLAVSVDNPGYAYTINDDEKNNDLIIYTIRIKTGDVVGVTTVAEDTHEKHINVIDPEALAMDGDGHLWIADTGSDGRDWSQDPATLYRIDEPGAGTHTPKAKRYPIDYAKGAHYNVETMLINPNTDKIFLVRKASADGNAPNTRLQFSTPLTAYEKNTPTKKEDLVDSDVRISDGSFTPNGKWAVIRNSGHKAYVYDPSLPEWKLHAELEMPDLKQPETLSFHPDGTRFLVGSEGLGNYAFGNSPLYWVGFNQSTGKAT